MSNKSNNHPTQSASSPSGGVEGAIGEHQRKIALNDYTKACNQLLRLFCAKHEYDYDPTGWVAGEPGGIASIGDYFVDMATIIADIKMEAPEEEFIRWYDYTLELGTIDPTIPAPNYEHWLRGCPRYSEERIASLRRSAQQVQEAKNRLDELIRETKEQMF